MDRVRASVSVIIPAHNEEPSIGHVVRSVADAVPDAEIVVVDDGSDDATSRSAADAGARVVRLDPNRGKGAAMRRGVDASTGDVLVFIDGDGQDNPYEIPLLVGAVAGEVDLVLGSRFLGTFRPGAITRLNYAGTKFITLAVRVLFGAGITDPLAGFRAIRRSAWDAIDLQANGYDVEVDMVARVLRAGGVVREMPASRAPRSHGESGLSSFRDGFRILRRIVQVRFEQQPAVTPAHAVVEARTTTVDPVPLGIERRRETLPAEHDR